MAISVPLEDNFEATLVQALAGDSSALTIYLSAVPVCTIPANKELVMTLAPGKGFTGSVQQENVLVESIDTVNNTVTVKAGGRAQARYNGDSASPISHSVGTKVIISDPFIVWGALDDYMPLAGGTFTGAVDFSGASTTFRLPNLTTAQRDALASPANGMKIYNTTTGEEQRYDGGSWVVVASGGTFPNASTTVAGKVEEATTAEVSAGTGTGGTGARLFINPESTVSTSAGAGDAGKVVKLDAGGKIDASMIDDSDVSVAKLETSGTANTTTTDQYALSYNGNTRLDLADANESALNAPFLFAGIANGASTSGNAQNYYQPGPIVTVPAFTLSQRANCRLWDGESNSTSDTTTDTINNTTAWRAETFVPQTGQDNVGAVIINITNSSLSATMQCKIYATSGGLPTGAALGTATALTTFSSGDNTFVFATPVSVTPGTTYAIVVHLSAYASGNFAWNYNSSSVYANGQRCTSPDSGANWTGSSTDCRFKVQYRGIAGEPVFLSDTAGLLQLSPGTYTSVVGQAISTTQIQLMQGLKMIHATFQATLSSTGTTDTEITVGFRPLMIFGHFKNEYSTPIFGDLIWYNASTPAQSKRGSRLDTASTGSTSTKLVDQNADVQLRDVINAQFYPSSVTIQANSANTVTVRRVVTGSTNNATFTANLFILGY